VSILDNLSTGFRENIRRDATFFEVDITQAEDVDRAFEQFRPEVVVHLAAQMDVRISTREPIFDATVNLMGSLNIILSSMNVGARKIVYASSGGAVYGDPERLPVREDHSINPISQYGITKHTVEHYLHLYERNHGLAFTVLRYPNVYGPRQNPKGEAGVVAIFARRLLLGADCVIFGDGEQVRDYVFVDDVVAANVRALTWGDGQVLNIGSGIGRSVNDIYTELSSRLGVTRKPVHSDARIGEVGAIVLDPTRAGEALRWKPEVPFSQGVDRTILHLQSLLAAGRLS
jgi:UDP-glucose 4-epimerase